MPKLLGLYERDYFTLTENEIAEKQQVDIAHGNTPEHKFGHVNCFCSYPKAIRHNDSLFPNNYLDIVDLKDAEELGRQCDGFERLLSDRTITELDIKRYIQNNKYYHIPASIFVNYNFGHHEAVLFKEFQLGTSYKADYLLAGRGSGGWQFVFVEFENPYGRVVLGDGTFGEVIRSGLNQVNDWKEFVEGNFPTVSSEFRKYTTKVLPAEFYTYDASRMHYVVVAGRRDAYVDKANRLRRACESEIKILHYDNLLDDARRLIGAKSY